MQAIARGRGRPKGTGIDDADRIARLIELMRVKPELKPTTAIRLMGFSDPSAIRRLRDKYKAFASSAAHPGTATIVALVPGSANADQGHAAAAPHRLP